MTDTYTGLVWQKDTGSDGELLNWCSALAYCENLELAGYDDWRLPNIRELQSIADYGRFFPAIDPVFDSGPLTPNYWSSTTRARRPVAAWTVVFDEGVVFAGVGLKDGRNHVRAVRSGP